MTWSELARYLSRPTVGEAKDEAGAWSPALYRANVRRKAALVRAHAIVVDVDDAGDVGGRAVGAGGRGAHALEEAGTAARPGQCRDTPGGAVEASLDPSVAVAPRPWRRSTIVVHPGEGAIVWAMAPCTRPNPQLVRPSAEEEAEIRAGLADLDRGEGVELTADELRHWAETGEWPERLD